VAETGLFPNHRPVQIVRKHIVKGDAIAVDPMLKASSINFLFSTALIGVLPPLPSHNTLIFLRPCREDFPPQSERQESPEFVSTFRALTANFGRGGRILVDDEPGYSEALADALEYEGHRVLKAVTAGGPGPQESGRSALMLPVVVSNQSCRRRS
jgi:hypothetical protein